MSTDHQNNAENTGAWTSITFSINQSTVFSYIRTFWSSEEDLKLLELYTEYGRRWKRISYSLVGRSENAIKNRFSLLWAKYKKRKSKDDIKEIREILEKRQKKTPSKDDPSKNGLEITNSSLEEQSKEEVRQKIEPGLENQQQWFIFNILDMPFLRRNYY